PPDIEVELFTTREKVKRVRRPRRRAPPPPPSGGGGGEGGKPPAQCPWLPPPRPPAEVGFIRLRPIYNAEIGQARFRMQAGEGAQAQCPPHMRLHHASKWRVSHIRTVASFARPRLLQSIDSGSDRCAVPSSLPSPPC